MTSKRGNGQARCIWMEAGVIAWRLCDRDFDCDSCPLDRALRGAQPEGRPAPPSGRAWPDDRSYHPAHLWVRTLDDGGARCGLDRAAAALLAPGGSLVLPALGQQLRRGRAGFWLLHESGPVPLRSPVNGRVRDRNQRLAAEPALPFVDPLDDGWLVEVAPPEVDDVDDDLLEAAEAESRAARQLERLRRRALHGDGDAPATMADGGEPAPDLVRRLGPRRWRRLVLPLLA